MAGIRIGRGGKVHAESRGDDAVTLCGRGAELVTPVAGDPDCTSCVKILAKEAAEAERQAKHFADVAKGMRMVQGRDEAPEVTATEEADTMWFTHAEGIDGYTVCGVDVAVLLRSELVTDDRPGEVTCGPCVIALNPCDIPTLTIERTDAEATTAITVDTPEVTATEVRTDAPEVLRSLLRIPATPAASRRREGTRAVQGRNAPVATMATTTVTPVESGYAVDHDTRMLLMTRALSIGYTREGAADLAERAYYVAAYPAPWGDECERHPAMRRYDDGECEACEVERQAINAELAAELAQEEWNQDRVNRYADQLIALDAVERQAEATPVAVECADAEATAAPMTAESLLNRLINFCASGSRFPSVGDVLAEAAVIVHGYGHERAVEWAAEALQDAIANRA